MAKPKQKREELDHEKLEAERAEREAPIDNEIATRTSRYDQDLKERARKAGINPDNFDTEEGIAEAVKAYEEENGSPELNEEGTTDEEV